MKNEPVNFQLNYLHRSDEEVLRQGLITGCKLSQNDKLQKLTGFIHSFHTLLPGSPYATPDKEWCWGEYFTGPRRTVLHVGVKSPFCLSRTGAFLGGASPLSTPGCLHPLPIRSEHVTKNGVAPCQCSRTVIGPQ